jgi:hypothetical protein
VAPASKKSAVKKKKKKKEPTPEQKHAAEKRSFARSIRTIFDRIGFQSCSAISDVEIEFDGRKGDFDDAFVYENVLLFVEYTVSNQSQVGDHVKGKAHLFAKIFADPLGFAAYMLEKFPDLKALVSSAYPPIPASSSPLVLLKDRDQERASGVSTRNKLPLVCTD